MNNSNFNTPELNFNMNYFIIGPILCLITFTTIFGNLLVVCDFLFRLKRNVGSRTPTQFFIANLAFCDFLVGLLVLPFLSLLQITGEWKLNYASCLMWIYFHCCLCAVSILSTLAICVERFVGVRFPIEHRNLLTSKNVLTVIGTFWILGGFPTALAVAFLTLPDQDWSQCDIKQQSWVTISYCLVNFHVPVFLMIILYVKIYQVAIAHIQAKVNHGIHLVDTNGNSFNSLTNSTGASNSENSFAERGKTIIQTKRAENSQVKQTQLAKKLSVLVGILIVSYFPYFTAIPLRSAIPHLISDEIIRSLSWFRYCNSCINPFIYFYAVPAYRKSMRNNLKKVRGYFSSN